MLVKIFCTSSSVMGGPIDAADESDAVDSVRDEDSDEAGGDPATSERSGVRPMELLAACPRDGSVSTLTFCQSHMYTSNESEVRRIRSFR